MTSPRPLSRRRLLKGLGGGAAELLVATTLAGCSATVTARGDPNGVTVASRSLRASSTVGPPFLSCPQLAPPRVRMDVHRGAASRGVVLTDCHGGAGQQGPMIIARSGELVWFLPVSRHGTSALRAFNLSRQHYHGEPVLCWFEGAVVDGHGQGHYVIADSSYRTIATVEAKAGLVADLHDFFLTKEDTAIFTAYGTASADLSARGGAKAGSYLYGVVQEVDLSTGKLLFSWRSDHHIGLGESYALPLPKKGPPWDYFHLNSVSLDPRDRHLIVSGRNTWAFYKVDRHSGKVLWRLGGKRSDFNLGRGCAFAYQHHVVAHRGGIYTIFDNEGAPWVHPPSRGLVLRVNEKRRTARLVQQYHHSPA
ncbi:MAG: arylsulfotransferase family protein, partial [Acidimicrobiales bacterium]